MNNITNKVADLLIEVRNKAPLIHNITNYVTVNDCANAIMAIGASPIMADDIRETEEITSMSSALVINIGTLNKRTIISMIASGKRANQLGIPVIFDPVGAGASKLRNDTTESILEQVKIAILRGNLSEVSFAAGLEVSTRGVDSSEADANNDGVAIAQAVAKKYGCVAAITGAVDIIADGERVVTIKNGHKMLSEVTGTGCMATSLVGSYAGVSSDYFTAAVGGVASMGIAGEIACEEVGSMGTGSFRMALIDVLSRFNSELMEKRLKLNEA